MKMGRAENGMFLREVCVHKCSNLYTIEHRLKLVLSDGIFIFNTVKMDGISRDVKVWSENCGSYDFSWAGACGKENFPPSAGDGWDFFASAGESVRKIKILEKFLKIFSVKFCGRKRENFYQSGRKRGWKNFSPSPGDARESVVWAGENEVSNFFSMVEKSPSAVW